jgi:hypothetical protein
LSDSVGQPKLLLAPLVRACTTPEQYDHVSGKWGETLSGILGSAANYAMRKALPLQKNTQIPAL